MHHSLKNLLVAATLFLGACGPPPDEHGAPPAAAPMKPGEVIPDSFIVVFRDQRTPVGAQMAIVTDFYPARPVHLYDHAIKGFSAVMSVDIAKVMARDHRVASITPNRVDAIADGVMTAKAEICLPCLFWSEIPTGIRRIGADRAVAAGAGIDVAVIDTGIAAHPDLPAVQGGINCAEDGTDFSDLHGHGTHVSGTIAARKNGFGVVGVASQANLWAVRVLDANGFGSDASVICGVDFVTAHAPGNGGPIKLANMSLGRYGAGDNDCGLTGPYTDPMHQAICRSRDAGVTYFVAAGNNDDMVAGFSPASYHDAVIVISALADSDGLPFGQGPATDYGPDDTFADFSNYGAGVDLGAPGVAINSTWLNNGYKVLSGTSMATPHGTGAGALYLGHRPDAPWTEIRDALRSVGERPLFFHRDPDGQHPEPVLNVDGL